MESLITGAEAICRALEREGVTTLFGYPGGAIMPFYHALPDHPRLRHVLVRHEQAAAHAADGWARVTGEVGVAVATSGPGATNLVTGLATAMMDSSPLVAITGQVPRAMLGRDAFQETDITGVVLPVTKHAILADDPATLAEAVHEAFAVAREGRPGPVLLDVPKDVQNAKVRPSEAAPHPRRPPASAPDNAYAKATALLARAERPLILAGHGVLLSGATEELRLLAERADVPVVTTLLGISALPSDHPLTLGMPGMHGEVHVNRAIQQADLLIAIGMRFDDRVTADASRFAPHAKVIHVEIDPVEIGKVIPATVALVGDARAVLRRWLPDVAPTSRPGWRATVDAMRRPRAEQWQYDLSPDAILMAIRELSGDESIVVSDVGQHQMWVAARGRWRVPRTHVTSGGLGTMGFAVPAAMGAAAARPEVPVWAISGDGGFQMNFAELATMVQAGIAVKLAVFNNGYLGMVRQWQQLFHERRYSETPILSPDYPLLAAAYGIPGRRVTRGVDIAVAVAEALATPGPALIEFVIEREANVWPMVPPGAALDGVLESAGAVT